jgi:hypothetical protein
MFVVVGLFIWAYYLANGMEQGHNYKVVGSNHSLAGLVIIIASAGTKKVMLIFGSLLGMLLISFIKKTKKPKMVHTIIVR